MIVLDVCRLTLLKVRGWELCEWLSRAASQTRYMNPVLSLCIHCIRVLGLCHTNKLPTSVTERCRARSGCGGGRVLCLPATQQTERADWSVYSETCLVAPTLTVITPLYKTTTSSGPNGDPFLCTLTSLVGPPLC